MEILKTSKELTPQEEYALTIGGNSKKMADAVGQRIEFTAWCLYNDANSDGEVKEILAVQTPEGEVLSSISPTFKEDFFKMIDFFKSRNVEVTAFTVVGGHSKHDRDFISCTYAA